MYQTETSALTDCTSTYEIQVKTQFLTIDTRHVNDLGLAKFKTQIDYNKD